jgi:hypothetical protein
VLAMAPATNIGSSTPINGTGANIGSDLRRKVVNDAAASLRGLAKTHGRNAAWADAAVRKASNLTADEALRRHVVDLISPSLPQLLRTIDGRKTVPRHFVLHTAGAAIVTAKPGFFTRFLSTLIDPNIVGLLFLAGLAGLGFELFHPGVVIPGAFGAICMVCALFGGSVLPLSWAGLMLVLLGAALLVIDAHVVTHGALTLSGLVDGGRARDAVPQGARAVPHERLARRRVHGDARGLLGVRDVEGDRRPAAAGERGPAADRRHGGRDQGGRPGLRPRRALAGPLRGPAGARRAGCRGRTGRLDPRRA